MIWRISDEELGTLGERIVAAVGARSCQIAHGELTVSAEAEDIANVLTKLRDNPDFAFQQLIDICGADYPQRQKRFDVVYHLLSLTKNRRVRVKVEADEATAVPSATGVYPCADWFEREAFDMYGIYFSGHPDLRRLLTDYGFQGHPLRKDFPMSGFVEVRYDEEQKRVVYEPVKITAFRAFDFLSPWEGAAYAMPGEERSE
ncbi:MAG TPA: NADH-quinone oxidoreductase subunit C, partial [Caulobacteraceae bacterium]